MNFHYAVLTLLIVVPMVLGFTCNSIGIYPDNESPSCDSYFVCSENETKRYTCPEGTLFSSRKLKCVPADNVLCHVPDVATTFKCESEGVQGDEDGACDDTVVCLETRSGSLVGLKGLCSGCNCNFTTDNTNSLSDSFECLAVGRFSDPDSEDCKSFNLCIQGAGTTLIRSKFVCPANTSFSNELQKCVLDSQNDCPTSTTAAPNFVCPSIGRFPNRNSSTCQEYYLCSVGDGGLEYVQRSCPARTIFNWETGRCVLETSYSCPNVVEVTTTTEATTTTTFLSFCTSVGRFPDVESQDCQSYIMCTEDANGVLVESVAKCPARTVFNGVTGRCVLATSYVCPFDSTAAPEPETTASLDNETESLFICPDVGRFPDEKSLNCKKYIICSRNPQGDLVTTTATCPLRTSFNENTGRCVLETTYQCPTQTTTTALPPFNCPDVGRYPNNESPDCKTYTRCIRNELGDLVPTTAACPANTVFSNDTKRCVLASTYKCPNL